MPRAREPQAAERKVYMYRKELLKAMVKNAQKRGKASLSVRQMDAALTALTESVTEALKNGDSVALSGFGVFGVRTRPAREGRNPFTGETLMIPEAKVPGFKAGKTLKDAVAGA